MFRVLSISDSISHGCFAAAFACLFAILPAGGASAQNAPLIQALNSGERLGLAQGGDIMPEWENVDLPQAMPVVLELFTSQGCSSCPPADAMLADLADKPDVLPLSFHVDYWDYLGWKDQFASPEFTERQKRYAIGAGERTIYTPQIIVGGTETSPTLTPSQLVDMIEMQKARPAMLAIDTSREDADIKRIRLRTLSSPDGPMSVMLVLYAPEREVQIGSGENRGRSITYTNIVLSVSVLAEWDGQDALSLVVRPGETVDEELPKDTRSAILVQQMSESGSFPGPMLAAVKLD